MEYDMLCSLNMYCVYVRVCVRACVRAPQGMSSLPDYVAFKSFPGTPLELIFSAATDDLLELLQGLFTFNPSTRTTATQVQYL